MGAACTLVSMRALVLSDIHANLEALDAVLTAAAGTFDTVWNLGDTVGYGGSPNEVIDRIRPLASLHVRGNHDRVATGATSALGFNPVARAAALWTQAALTPENLSWLRAVPQGPLHPEGLPHGAAITCAHGSPLNEDQYILNMRDAWMPLQQMSTAGNGDISAGAVSREQGTAAAITFIGHTHIQGGFSQKDQDWYELRPQFPARTGHTRWSLTLAPGTRHLINPGSVGQPRDADWRAAFAIYDTGTSEITYYRVPYDLTASQGRILLAGLPERLAARLREGR